MKSEADIRDFLDQCTSHAREANLAAASFDPSSDEFEQARRTHLVWINVEQAMRWVLDGLEAEFTPLQVE